MTARTQACVELLQPRDLTSLIPGITVEYGAHVPGPNRSLISVFINPSHFYVSTFLHGVSLRFNCQNVD